MSSRKHVGIDDTEVPETWRVMKAASYINDPLRKAAAAKERQDVVFFHQSCAMRADLVCQFVAHGPQNLTGGSRLR